MKILMLSPYAPARPDSGSLIRIWEQIRYLGARHELTVGCLAETESQLRATPAQLAPHCRQVFVHPLQGQSGKRPTSALPEAIEHYSCRALRDSLRGQTFDLVLCELIYMAQYADLFSAPCVLQEHNIESELYSQHVGLHPGQRLRWKMASMLMASYENRMWPQFPLRVTVSAQDCQRMQARCSAGRSIVVPNGADVSQPCRTLTPGQRQILFCGNLRYLPNVDAARRLVRDVMPLVWRKSPQMRLIIVGKDPAPEVCSLAQEGRVEVIGNPASMLPLVDRSSVMAVPLRVGSGTRIKILEAQAWGLPVVSSQIGCEGLEGEDGTHLLIRDEPEAFAEALLQLHEEGALWERLREQGRAFVEARHSWTASFAKLEAELPRMVLS